MIKKIGMKGKYIAYQIDGEVVIEDIHRHRFDDFLGIKYLRAQTDSGVITCTPNMTRAELIPFDPHVMNKKIKVLEYSI